MERWFWQRPADPTARALDFLNSLRHDALVEPWVIGRRRGNYLEDAATLPPGKLAHDWIAARAAKQQLYCMAGEVAGAPQGTVTEAHVVSTRIIAVSIPKPRLEQALAFGARPAIVIETERGYALGWRLHNPVEPYIAKLHAKAVADALGGEPLPFILPLPGTAGVGRPQYLKGPRHWTLLTDLSRRTPQPVEAPRDVQAFRPAQQAVTLGTLKAGGEAYWAPFENGAKLLNFGILVTGDPGSGKTQTLNVLIDGVARMGLPVCIFDFKNDYSRTRLRAGHRTEGPRCAPPRPSLQPADALGRPGRPSPTHRAHFHPRGRIEARVQSRRPPGRGFARGHEGGFRAVWRRSAKVGGCGLHPGAKLR